MAPRRVLLFAALLLPLLVVPRAAPAQESTWVLTETIVNPTGAPTEFIVGTTPNYYESPRFDGTYERYTVSPALLGMNWRSVEREFVFWDVTISFAIDPPPPVLIPGETITLGASGTASGFYADAWNPFGQFEFRAEGANMEGETFMAVGVNPDLVPISGVVNPTFVVPEPWSDEAEIRIVAGMWNCAACSVVWVYRPEMAAPTTTAQVTTSTSSPPATSTPDEPSQCTVRGVVTDAGARPESRDVSAGHQLAWVRVSLLLPSLDEHTIAATDADGRYEITVDEDDLPGAIDSGVD